MADTGEIRVIRRGEPEYPRRFLGLPGMPERLYVRGSLPSENEPTAAIVGARLCSHYGHQVAETFGRVLAEEGVQVISGMALGIDVYAQEGALEGGGRSWAVLGCGVDICYPRTNRKTYDCLIHSGGVISEEAPGTQPASWNFPRRNRLISALADVVVVVEAKEKSGSLITVDFALEQGKTVMAVPGRISDALSEGCNRLIAQGAGIALNPEAVLSEIAMLSGKVSDVGDLRAAGGSGIGAEAGGGIRAEAGGGSGAERGAGTAKREIRGRAGAAPAGKRESASRSRSLLSYHAQCVLSSLTEAKSLDTLVDDLPGFTTQEIMTALVELLLGGYVDEIARHTYEARQGLLGDL